MQQKPDQPAPKYRGLIRRLPGKKTLVFCPIGLGNFLMVSPSLRRLSQEIGRENLHILALKPGIKQMAEASGLFGSIHFFDPDKGSKANLLKMLVGLRGEKYDLGLSLFPTGDWRFSVFALLAGPRRRVGFNYPLAAIAAKTQHFSAPINFDLHDTDQNSDFIDELLNLPTESEREIVFPFESKHPLQDELEGLNYFVCHPGSSAERGMKEKRLPPREFADLIARLDETFGLKCQLIGGPEEADLRAEIEALVPQSVLQYTTRNLSELGGLIAPAKFYVGNDSGLMHISTGLGKRCIAFFGPTDDKRNGPYATDLRTGRSTTHLIVRADGLACSPCRSARTIGTEVVCIYGDTRCLKDFNIDAWWPRIENFVRSMAYESRASLVMQAK